MGPRYNPLLYNKIKIVSKKHLTFGENYQNALDQFNQMYLEAMRAPSDSFNLHLNPYRREQLIKKLYGRTSEERKEKRKQIAE